MINRGIKAIKTRGLAPAVKTASTVAGNVLLDRSRDCLALATGILMGPQRAVRFHVAIHRFRCRYRIFMGSRKSLRFGKFLRHHVYKVTRVNPADINLVCKGGTVPYIQDGDWDLNTTEWTMYETISELFVENRPPCETAQYRRMKESVERGEKAYWCRTPDDVERYFQILIDTYRDIRENGYRSHLERETGGKTRQGGYYPDDVLVSIDREGRYLLERGGTHRLSIARLLSLTSIPVIVIRKHYRYVLTRTDWLE